MIDVLQFIRQIWIWIWIRVANAADDELMQMAVGPTEGGLKHRMQFRKLDGLGHGNAAPYARGYTEELNFKLPGPGLLAARGDSLRHYAAILSGSRLGRQVPGQKLIDAIYGMLGNVWTAAGFLDTELRCAEDLEMVHEAGKTTARL